MSPLSVVVAAAAAAATVGDDTFVEHVKRNVHMRRLSDSISDGFVTSECVCVCGVCVCVCVCVCV